MGSELILSPAAHGYLAELGYASAEDVLFDPRGWTIRCTPHRRTVVQELSGGRRLFRKIRSSGLAQAKAEWNNLGTLRARGIPLPEPVVYARMGAASVVGMLDVPGRPMDSVLAGYPGGSVDWQCLSEVVELVRAIHAAGYCYRDLYWAHLYAAGDADHWSGISIVDAERAFRPRFRWRRWLVKDLAGLLASWPASRPPRVLLLRMLRAYLGDDFSRGWKPLARSVLNRARRIRAHRPRYGDLGFRW